MWKKVPSFRRLGVAGGLTACSLAFLLQAGTSALHAAPNFQDGNSGADSGMLAPANENSIIVTTTANTIADDGETSLPEALEQDTLDHIPTTILFNIPKTDPGYQNGVFTIQLNESALTVFDDDTKILGSSQTRYTGDSNPLGPEIEIRGTAQALAVSTGINVFKSRCLIEGLAVNNFQNNIAIRGNQTRPSGGSRIVGCYVGLAANGQIVPPTSSNPQPSAIGIVVAGALDVQIGGRADGERNYIGNNVYDIVLEGGEGPALQARVENNYLGLTVDGRATPRSEVDFSSAGILIGSSKNMIGGTASGARNLIANHRYGVRIDGDATGSAVGNTIRGNSIRSIDKNAIWLQSPGSSGDNVPNDNLDSDGGANNLQNFPVLSRAGLDGDNLTVQGSLDSTPNTTFLIDYYNNPAPDSRENGEGYKYLGSQEVRTDAQGHAALSGQYALGRLNAVNVTATATDIGTGDTSPFSKAISADYPRASVNDISIIEGTRDENASSFTVTLSKPSEEKLVFEYRLQNGDGSDGARAGYNYQAPRPPAVSTVTFEPGQTVAKIYVPTINDRVSTGPKQFTLRLLPPRSDISGPAFLDRDTGTATIINNDSFPEDVTPPLSVTVQTPPDQSFQFGLPLIIAEAQDNDGGSGIASVTIELKRVSDGLYWTGSAWGEKTPLTTELTQNADGSTRATRNSGLPFAESLAEGEYQIHALATDRAGLTKSADSAFTISKSVPTIAITFPSSNAGYLQGMPVHVTGTASDSGSGVDRIKFILVRKRDGYFWNGSAWQKNGYDLAGKFTPTGDGNVTWSDLDPLPRDADVEDGNYFLEATVFNRAGNSALARVDFSIDFSNPRVSITAPNNGAYAGVFPSVTGNAFDDSRGSGLERVELVLRRNSDGQYWTGFGWGERTALSTKIAAGPDGTRTWSRTSYLPRLKDLQNGNYTVAAYAYDRAGHGAATSVTVKIDAELPTIAITTPADGARISELRSITGTAADTGGSGLDRIEIYLRRNADGLYWTGSTWGDRTALRAKPVNPNGWVRDTFLPTAGSLTPGNYTLAAYAVDKAGNSNGISVTLRVQATAPPAPTVGTETLSPVALSQASVDSDAGTVKLVFTGPLNVGSATTVENYAVTVNELNTGITSAQLVDDHTVVLGLEDALASGTVVEIAYSLRDGNNASLRGTARISLP